MTVIIGCKDCSGEMLLAADSRLLVANNIGIVDTIVKLHNSGEHIALAYSISLNSSKWFTSIIESIDNIAYIYNMTDPKKASLCISNIHNQLISASMNDQLHIGGILELIVGVTHPNRDCNSLTKYKLIKGKPVEFCIVNKSELVIGGCLSIDNEYKTNAERNSTKCIGLAANTLAKGHVDYMKNHQTCSDVGLFLFHTLTKDGKFVPTESVVTLPDSNQAKIQYNFNVTNGTKVTLSDGIGCVCDMQVSDYKQGYETHRYPWH